MHALVLRDWGAMSVEDRPAPTPGPGQVRLRITATGICGSDLHGFTGENGRRRLGQVMGHETVGTIDDIGPETGLPDGVTADSTVTVNPVIGCGTCPDCRSGNPQVCQDRIVIGVAPEHSSAFAEQMLAPAANLVALPPGTPVEHGALVEPLAVGYHAARRGHCNPDDRVLVIGAGPIGQAAILAARRLGSDSIAVVEPDRHRIELAHSLGATGLDPASADLAGAVSNALGGPATLTLDAVGSTGSLKTALEATAPGGRVVLVGMNEQEVHIPAYAISTQERSIIGSFCYSPTDFADTADWVGHTDAPLDALIDGRVSLEEAPAMFSDLAARRVSHSKVLVYPGGR